MMKAGLIALVLFVLAAPVVTAVESQDVPEILGEVAYQDQVAVMDDAALAGVQGTLLPPGHPPLIDSLIAFKNASQVEKLQIIVLHLQYIFGKPTK
ncbi:MAG: hypothetical protein JXB13_14585 [Phycisphaerae bacterium]|nr:hypothetical protein [Phycisphaerae bacterium]